MLLSDCGVRYEARALVLLQEVVSRCLCQCGLRAVVEVNVYSVAKTRLGCHQKISCAGVNLPEVPAERLRRR